MGLENVENASGPEQGVMVSRDVRWKLLLFQGVGEPLKSFKQGGEEVLVRPIASHLVPSDDPPASICQHRIGPPSHREAEVTCRLGCDCVCVCHQKAVDSVIKRRLLLMLLSRYGQVCLLFSSASPSVYVTNNLSL